MALNLEDNKWLLATLASALCWSAADILCDMCIGEEDDDEEDGYEMVKLSSSDDAEQGAGKADNGIPKSGFEPKALKDGGENQENRAANMNGPEPPSTAWSSSSSTGGGRIGEGGIKKRRTNSGSNSTGGNERPESLMRRIKASSVTPEETDTDGSEPPESRPLRPEVTNSGDPAAAQEGEEDEEEHLDGVQDTAIAGLTTMVVMYALALKRVHATSSFGSSSPAGGVGGEHYSASGAPLIKFLWSPSADSEWWMATCSGSLMFTHYLFLLMAFDHAPSTVINPLVQVSSTWMLLGSAVPALLTGGTFIRPADLVCYLIIVAGGILPSLDGNFKRMLTRQFWQQPFVRNTVISEIAVGIYDLVMSYCLQTSGKKEKFREISPADLEFEFFFIAWCGFVVSFCVTFSLLPGFRQRFLDLRNIPRKILVLSSLGQSLTLAGYYASQFAYSWYYQASIVHAAEASLSQAFNLLFAVLAFKCFGIGRESAIDNLRIKILSCIVVSAGLFLLSLNEPGSEVGPHVMLKTSEIISNLDLESQLDLGVIHGRLLL